MSRWATGFDTAWLQLERTTNRMVIHGVLFCDGPVEVEALRARIAERWIPTYPPLRQTPTWPLGPYGPARWVDDDPDLTRHVDTAALDAPGDDTALNRYIGGLMSQPLPVDRPWWAIHVLTGYAGTGTAVVVRIHHGLADGVALNHLFHSLADDPEQVADGTPPVYAARPETRGGVRDARLMGNRAKVRAKELGRQLRGWTSAAGRRDLAATAAALRTSTGILVNPPPEARTALQSRVGVDKSARWSGPVAVETVKAAGKAHGGSVNDVVCAVIAEALREFLGADGSAVPRMRAVVPSNLRNLDRAISSTLGNEVGLVLPTLPTDEPDAGRRIERMHATMSTIKRTDQSLVVFAGLAGAGHAAASFTQGMIKRYAKSTSLIITNVPGPVGPLDVVGTRIRSMMFWVPCSGDLALGVSILSYAGELRLGVAADTGVLGGEEGVDRFLAALDGALSRL